MTVDTVTWNGREHATCFERDAQENDDELTASPVAPDDAIHDDSGKYTSLQTPENKDEISRHEKSHSDAVDQVCPAILKLFLSAAASPYCFPK